MSTYNPPKSDVKDFWSGSECGEREFNSIASSIGKYSNETKIRCAPLLQAVRRIDPGLWMTYLKYSTQPPTLDRDDPEEDPILNLTVSPTFNGYPQVHKFNDCFEKNVDPMMPVFEFANDGPDTRFFAKKAPYVARTFTTKGLGYTFNGANLVDFFRRDDPFSNVIERTLNRPYAGNAENILHFSKFTEDDNLLKFFVKNRTVK